MATNQQIREIERRIKELNEKFTDMGGEIDEEMGDRLHEYKDMLKEKSKYIWGKAQRSGREVDRYVSERPWHSVGAAFLVGWLIGLIVGRRG